MLSLKPPWKQKNPIMEKACQAYHKQTAPAKAVEVLDEVKVVRGEETLEEEVVGTRKIGNRNVTTALFKDPTYGNVIVEIFTSNGNLRVIRVGKTVWAPRVEVFYRGEKILSFPAKHQRVKDWKP